MQKDCLVRKAGLIGGKRERQGIKLNDSHKVLRNRCWSTSIFFFFVILVENNKNSKQMITNRHIEYVLCCLQPKEGKHYYMTS
jgi:hypothetical protein